MTQPAMTGEEVLRELDDVVGVPVPVGPYGKKLHRIRTAVASLLAERDGLKVENERIARFAEIGSLDSWIRLSDDDKRKWFVMFTDREAEYREIIRDLCELRQEGWNICTKPVWQERVQKAWARAFGLFEP
jgi:regulator of replication initiation timing